MEGGGVLFCTLLYVYHHSITYSVVHNTGGCKNPTAINPDGKNPTGPTCRIFAVGLFFFSDFRVSDFSFKCTVWSVMVKLRFEDVGILPSEKTPMSDFSLSDFCTPLYAEV